MKVDVVVIGGGAAGLFCALTAGQRGRKVIVLEHRERVGLKIAISGGGRCNFTNLHAEPENYLSGNSAFCRSALARYSPWDFIGLVEKHGIAYHEKKLGQQFCDTSSRQIIQMLLDECAAAGVEIWCGCRVDNVEKPGAYRLTTSKGELEADAVVIATGGLSFANLGATDFGYRIAKQFGLRVTELRPGLVPLTFSPSERAVFAELSGVAIPVVAQLGLHSFSEAALFTHRGLSGPAILQISSFWRDGLEFSLDLLPGVSTPIPADTPKTSLPSLLGSHWPRRLADVWAERYAPQKPINQWSPRERADINHRLHAWQIQPSGTEGYPKAEVTVGGVDTSELSSKTMEARHVPGLYFIGEVVDVTGWLGGYNFQWAWASGHAAGSVV
ncbi:MAG: NAD(P)/FAD-dependent oxidoreductase [Chthoniobacterales bacterium]